MWWTSGSKLSLELGGFPLFAIPLSRSSSLGQSVSIHMNINLAPEMIGLLTGVVATIAAPIQLKSCGSAPGGSFITSTGHSDSSGTDFN